MKSIGKAVAIFVGLAIVFTVLIVATGNMPGLLEQLILVSLGSAIFGSGLTFFLVRATQLDERK